MITRLDTNGERRWKRYPEYRHAVISHAVTHGLDSAAALKDSGVPYWGQIPSHWTMTKLRHLVPDHRQIMYGIVLPGPHVDDGIPIVKGGNCEPGRLRLDVMSRTSREIEAGYERSRLREGDIVYAIRGSIGAADIVPAELNGANLTQDAARIALKRGVCPRWLLYTVRSGPFFAKLDAGALGATIRGINIRDLKRADLPLPPFHEQRAIVAFLDRETARIDALIERKEKLIALLEEKRQAVINYAVSRGLDPAAPLKDSGVPWLGMVPKHWRVQRIKWVAKLESGHTPDKKVESYWTDCDIPWVSLNDTGYLKEHDYISDTAYQVNQLGLANSSARLLPARAVVFSRDATIGRCAITTRPMAVSQHFIAWLCRDSIIPEYLLRVLRAMQQDLERLTMGATIKTIGMPDVRTLTTPVPPVVEQAKIIKYVETKTAAIDKVLARTSDGIAHLQEYRTALISAAVTGQIDVRGEVKP